MFKELGVIVGGIFIGAVGVEVLRKKCPGTLDKLYAKTREIPSEVKEAFRKGYENASRSQQSAEPSA